MKKSIVFLVLVISLNSFGEILTLEEAIREGKENHYKIKDKIYDVEIAKMQIDREEDNLIPPITISGDISTDDDFSKKRNLLGIESVGGKVPVFPTKRLFRGYEMAKIDNEITEKEFKDLEAIVKEEIVSQYFEVLKIEKEIDILEGVRETLIKQRTIQEKLYNEARLVPKGELLKVQNEVIITEIELKRKHNDVLYNKSLLLLMLGRKLGGEISLIDDTEEITLRKYNLNTAIEYAFTTGEKLKTSILELEKAEIDYKIAKDLNLPTIWLGAEYDLYEKNSEFSAGFTYDVLSIKRNRENIKQMEKKIEKVGNSIDTQKEQITLDITNKYNEMELLKELVQAYRDGLEINRENDRISTLRFNNSLIGAVEYLEGVSNLKESEKNYFNSKRDLIIAIERFEHSWK